MSIHSIGQCKTVFPERDNRGEGTLQSPTSLHPSRHPPAIHKSNSGLCPPSPSQGRQTPDTFSVFLQDKPTSSCQPILCPGSLGQTWPRTLLMPCLTWHTCPQACLMPCPAWHTCSQVCGLRKQQITARPPCCESGTWQTPSSPH